MESTVSAGVLAEVVQVFEILLISLLVYQHNLLLVDWKKTKNTSNSIQMWKTV